MKVKEYSVFGYPAFLWFIFFVGIPLLLIFALSFLTRGTYGGIDWQLTLQNYSRIFNLVYLKIFFQTIRLALLTAFICLLLAYPMAWAMATATPRGRAFFVVGLAVPFLTNLIIRVYAIMVFVGIDGPLQRLMLFCGIVFDPFYLSQNDFLVLYGMVTTYLPFMVFPLYVALEKFDFSLVEAAEDLGASKLRVLLQVIVPNTRVAASNGLTMVFVPCLGEFIIPDLLGGAKNMLVGNLITEQFLKNRDWPFGSALSIVLIALLFFLPYLIKKLWLLKTRVRRVKNIYRRGYRA